MIHDPTPAVVEAFGRFAVACGAHLEKIRFQIGSDSDMQLPAIKSKDCTVVFGEVLGKIDDASLIESVRKALDDSLTGDHSFEVMLVNTGEALSKQRVVLGRGMSIVSLHTGIARLLGLPDGWLAAQRDLLLQTMSPVIVNGRPELATLYAIDENNQRGSVENILREMLQMWGRDRADVLYLRAEAGKGKSTSLAHAAFQSLSSMAAPLPVFFPLRMLQRGRGISWEELCSSINVIGSSSEKLAIAARAGLVSLLLDGLDEVSGRYDPSVIQQVVEAIRSAANGSPICVVMSGRTTEATLLSDLRAKLVGLELPDPEEPAFTTYAKLVVSDITPSWPMLAARVPEPPVAAKKLHNAAPTSSEKERILEWVQLVFEFLGKDRSLFFVQSLACLGRCYQLDGNQPLVIRQPHEVKVANARLYDVSVLAAALACIREQDKVEDIAKTIFEPSRQMDVLMLYAIQASVESSIAGTFPTPNEAAQKIFGIDPVNQNEEFTAILRQIQKHALLFASAGAGLRAGDWRPHFLSDWVRSALLCRAWLKRKSMNACGTEQAIAKAIARAERARIAYQVLVPELVDGEILKDEEILVNALVHNIANESPEACSNYWALVSGRSKLVGKFASNASMGLVPLGDLSGLTFDGVEFDERFSGTLAVLVETEFNNCKFASNSVTQSDLTNGHFVGCVFKDFSLSFCDGPLTFEDCEFRNANFENMRSIHAPALNFLNCRFENGCKIRQSAPMNDSGLFVPICEFTDCATTFDPKSMFEGESVGLARIPPSGLSLQTTTARPEEATLRALLKPFFPRRAGTGDDLQARGYIRSSAIGRGVVIDGAPGARELMQLLSAIGFTAGGRQGHIYAPWSSVVGGGTSAVNLRNELLAFLRSGKQGEAVKQLLTRIRQLTGWKK